MERDIFCRIVEGAIPATKLYEDQEVLAFADINPLAPTHLLVIPKKHFTSLNDLNSEHEKLLGHMILVAQKVAKEHGIASNGYRLVINCGKHGRQVVPHLHLHLLGGCELGEDLC